MVGNKHLLVALIAILLAKVDAAWHFITYADRGEYLETAHLYKASYAAAGFASFTHWDHESFQKSKWYTQNKEQFVRSESIGTEKARSRHHWLWKPMIILDALERLPENDWVFYSDASSYHKLPISPNFRSVMPKLEALAGLNGHHQCDCIPVTRLPLSIGWEFALRAHVGADLATAIQQVSPEAPFQPWGSWAMGQASWSLWRNDYRSKRFVREWIRMMQNEKLLAAVPFADQTICELLVAKHNMKAFWWPHPKLFEQKNSGDYNGAGNPVKGILYEAAIASFKDTASMEYLHWQHPVDLASKKVAICVMGLPGSTDPRAGASWKDQVLRVLDADLFVVSTAWPIDGWPAAKAAMVNDFDVLAFFNSHVPTWSQSARGDNFLNGLPGFSPGSGAYQVASRYWCSKLINETEQQRGFPYDYVGVGRLDLFWPHPHPTLQRLADPRSKMPECWVPCVNNDWFGTCDQYAFCRRSSMVAITTGLLDVLPVRGQSLNTERHLNRSMETYHARALRFDVGFIRSCEDPKITGKVNPKCGLASKLNVYGKISGEQLKEYN